MTAREARSEHGPREPVSNARVPPSEDDTEAAYLLEQWSLEQDEDFDPEFDLDNEWIPF